MPSNINFIVKNKIKKKKIPNDPIFFQHVTVNTLIIFFGLTTTRQVYK